LEFGVFWSVEGADILFLSEPKLDKRRMEHFLVDVGVKRHGGTRLRRKRSGLVVFWRRGIDLVLRNYSENHIDAMFVRMMDTSGDLLELWLSTN